MMDSHVDIAFRNPIPAPVPHRAQLLRDATYAIQLYDAANSAQHARNPNWHEFDPVYKPVSHSGELGYAAGFLCVDAALHGAINLLHLGPKAHNAADIWMATQSATGILNTNSNRLK
jgi:hypothetical protein